MKISQVGLMVDSISKRFLLIAGWKEMLNRTRYCMIRWRWSWSNRVKTNDIYV